MRGRTAPRVGRYRIVKTTPYWVHDRIRLRYHARISDARWRHRRSRSAVERTRALADERGWTVVGTYVDNDVSAYLASGVPRMRTCWRRSTAARSTRDPGLLNGSDTTGESRTWKSWSTKLGKGRWSRSRVRRRRPVHDGRSRMGTRILGSVSQRSRRRQGSGSRACRPLLRRVAIPAALDASVTPRTVVDCRR